MTSTEEERRARACRLIENSLVSGRRGLRRLPRTARPPVYLKPMGRLIMQGVWVTVAAGCPYETIEGGYGLNGMLWR
jgi:hypothetical protein